MKKRILVTVTAVVLTLALAITGTIVGISVFRRQNEGEIVTVDGYRQNTKVYVKDATYADGNVSFTVVNDTWREEGIEHAPFLERKEGDRWVLIYWETPMLEPKGPTIEAFGELQMSFSLRQAMNGNVIPGEYRFIYGNLIYDYGTEFPEDMTKPIGFTYNTYYDPPICVVGTVLVTEEMLAASAS